MEMTEFIDLKWTEELKKHSFVDLVPNLDVLFELLKFSPNIFTGSGLEA